MMKKYRRIFIVAIIAIVSLVLLKLMSVLGSAKQRYLIKNEKLYSAAVDAYYNVFLESGADSIYVNKSYSNEGCDSVHIKKGEESYSFKTDYSDWDLQDDIVVGTSALGAESISVDDNFIKIKLLEDNSNYYVEEYYVYSIDGSRPWISFCCYRVSWHWYYVGVERFWDE